MNFILKGNSRATVQIINNKLNEKVCVRKKADSVEFNNRLIMQYNKHLRFHNSGISSPEIYSSGYIDDCFYYDMEYINSLTLSNYIANGYEISNKIEQDLNKLLEHFSTKKLQPVYDKYAFQDKINKINNIINFNKDEELDSIYIYLKSVDWPYVPIEQSHGDLTLDNILVNNGKLIFIDFDYVEHDSPFLDAVKILQDTRCHWCFRDYDDINLNNINSKLSKIEEISLKFIHLNYPSLVEYINLFLLYHLYRILPYSKNIKTTIFLKKQINKLI